MKPSIKIERRTSTNVSCYSRRTQRNIVITIEDISDTVLEQGVTDKEIIDAIIEAFKEEKEVSKNV